VARVFSRERSQVSKIIKDAIKHPGFSFVHDLSPCVEFNKLITYKSWKEVVGEFPDDYAADDRGKALQYAESTEPIYLGLFFKQNIPTFQDNRKKVIEQIRGKSSERD